MKGQSSMIMLLGFMMANSLPCRNFKEGTEFRELRQGVGGEEGHLRVGDDPHVPKLFGTEWAEQYFNASTTVTDAQNCYPGRGSYIWRIQGFGSNMNSESSGVSIPRENVHMCVLSSRRLVDSLYTRPYTVGGCISRSHTEGRPTQGELFLF